MGALGVPNLTKIGKAEGFNTSKKEKKKKERKKEKADFWNL